MKTLVLKRVSNDLDTTFGVLIDYPLGEPLCLTIENLWLDNKPFVSCIPEGEYFCRRVISSKTKSKETFRVDMEQMNKIDNRSRSFIDFHPGNTHYDTAGCILPVMSFHDVLVMKYEEAVFGGVSSLNAFNVFMEHLENEKEFQLIIEDHT